VPIPICLIIPIQINSFYGDNLISRIAFLSTAIESAVVNSDRRQDNDDDQSGLLRNLIVASR